MSTLRPGRAYHHPTGHAWARQSRKRPKKGYAKGVPLSKIFHFELGNAKKKDEYPVQFNLVSSQWVQMRSNCMESARITIGEYMKKIVEENYFAKILLYPHCVLRENPLATGAGADRFSTGMRMAFGKPIGTAARVKIGQSVINMRVQEGKEAQAKEALRRAARKLPGVCRIVRVVAKGKKNQ